MENSKWAQNKSSMLSEIESLKNDIVVLKEYLATEKQRTNMYDGWYKEYRAEAMHHKAVSVVLQDHLETLKQIIKPVEVVES